jgi:CheY-like chemotaxis protein
MDRQSSSEILIVDDIPANLNILCQALEPEGYNIIAAPSGEVALQIAART